MLKGEFDPRKDFGPMKEIEAVERFDVMKAGLAKSVGPTKSLRPFSLRLLSTPTFGLTVATLVPGGIFKRVSVVVITISSIRVARPRAVSLIHLRRSSSH